MRYGPIIRVLRRAGAEDSLLEVGVGVGALSFRLARRFQEYRGYEQDRESFQVACGRLAALPQAELVNSILPAEPDRTFGVLGAFEVLEHIEDDLGTLREWVQWLRPGGLGVFSVPAHPEWFGPLDVSVGHFRRYSRSEILGLLEGAGLTDIEIGSYGFPVVNLMHWVRRRIVVDKERIEQSEKTARSGRSLQTSGYLGKAIDCVIQPWRVIQRPFERSGVGIGWVVTGRKPAES